MKPKIKLICFDLNKTLIRENTWLELNQALGMIVQEDQKLYDLYNSGKLSYVVSDYKSKIVKISRSGLVLFP